MPLAHDMIGLYLAVGSSNHLPPWGGRDLLLGTNPIAIAVPALEEPPIVLDMAPTVAAFGKVRLKAQRGEPMPVGWMIDQDGKPLTDATRAEEGYLLPIGEYKGYGLSLMIGLLAGALNRAAFGRDVIDMVSNAGAATNTGHAILAISIDTFGPAEQFKRHVDAVIRDIRGSARLPGVERIWLPGEQSAQKLRDRTANGIPIPKALKDSLDGVARDLGIAPLSSPSPGRGGSAKPLPSLPRLRGRVRWGSRGGVS
jgi:LDH2 family malate/lactate/ureidoglycolate dehydrogenase